MPFCKSMSTLIQNSIKSFKSAFVHNINLAKWWKSLYFQNRFFEKPNLTSLFQTAVKAQLND